MIYNWQIWSEVTMATLLTLDIDATDLKQSNVIFAIITIVCDQIHDHAAWQL